MPDAHEFAGDAAAYVLGALESDELEAFRTHLETCPICRDEVASLQQVADSLPMAAAQYRAPSELRDRVLSDIRAEPRQPHAGAAEQHAAPPDPRAAASEPQPARRRRLPRFVLPRPVLVAGLAAVFALAVVGVVELASSGSSGVRVIPARTAFASASAEVRLGDGRSELVVANMPPPGPGHIYEVWLQRGDHAPSPTNALFSVSSTGAGNVGIPGSLEGVSRVLVTPEPAGGSKAPTHAPVIVAELA